MRAQSVNDPVSTNGWNGATESMELSNVRSIPVAGYRHRRNSREQQDYLLVPDSRAYPPLQRLVVIVPAGDLDEQKLGLQIGRLALSRRLSILFLAKAANPEMDCCLHRRLVTLTSLVKDSRVRMSARLAFHENWVQVVEEVWQEGDLLVCIEGHQIPSFLSSNTELAPYLVSTLGVPAYVLTGIKLTREPVPWSRWRELLIWAASIAVIVLFGLLQAYIDRRLQGSGSTLLLILSVIPEALLLWKLNFLE